jgi:squalene synthase HpnC
MAGAFGERRDAGSLGEAYAYCQQVARRHYENFPVASWLLPKAMRPHVAAVYAFARSADDLADEGLADPAARERALDDYLARLRAAVSEAPPASSARPDLVFTALGATIRECDLPVALFEDLLSAFRQDVRVVRYRTWDELFDYCRRSANPVGRLVLRIAGYRERDLDAASDAVCTALQLTNFWQDLDIDWQRGRLYLPSAERDEVGAREEELDRRRLTAPWRVALERAAMRTRALFDRGRLVADRIPGRLGFELRLTWLGGVRILERLAQVEYDVFTRRPSLGARDAAVILSRAVVWSRPAVTGTD